jgi:hypothetical protein
VHENIRLKLPVENCARFSATATTYSSIAAAGWKSGTIAARLLVEFGMAPTKAIATVRAARPGTIENKD